MSIILLVLVCLQGEKLLSDLAVSDIFFYSTFKDLCVIRCKKLKCCWLNQVYKTLKLPLNVQ